MAQKTASTGPGERCHKIDYKYKEIIKLLAYTVEEKVYGPVDRMARALSSDAVKMALYEAIRYATSGKERENLDVEGLHEEINCLLCELGRGLTSARDIALKALAKGLKAQREKAQRKKAEVQAGETKEAEQTQRS